MTDHHTEFLIKLAALMEEYGVSIAAAEDPHSNYADGINIEFDYQTIPIGYNNTPVSANDIRKYLEKVI